MRRILIGGTGTNVGKTEVTCLLARGARLHGLEVAALKPVESGVDPAAPSDSERLGDAAGHAPLALHRFRAPESPHVASRLEGVSVDELDVARWVDANARACTFVEPAGGLFSPTSAVGLGVDWVERLRITDAFLVAPGRLGVIHDVSATLLGARGAGVAVPWRAVLVTPLEGEELGHRKCAELRETAIARWRPGLPVVAVSSVTRAGWNASEASRSLWAEVASLLGAPVAR